MQAYPGHGIDLRSALAVSVLAFLALAAFPVLADDFSASATPGTVRPNLTSMEFNLTVSNTDSLFNITEVRITLPAGTAFIEGTNQTNSTWPGGGYFANTSATVLVWGNLSINDTLVENGTDVLFVLNASVPDVSDTRSFTVLVYDNASSSNSTTLSIDIDGAAPEVNLTGPENNANFSSGSLDFNFTVTDNNATTMSCTFYYDGQPNATNSSTWSNVTTTFSMTEMAEGQHNWTVSCNDSMGNEANSSRDFGIYPDIEVVSITWASVNGSGGIDNRTGPGDNITVWAQVRNTGDFNLSGNATNVTFHLYWKNTGTKVSEYYLDNDTLTNGTSVWFQFPDNITSGVTNGRHSIIVRADATGNATEANETNDFYFPKIVGYDVTVNSVSPWYVQERVNMTLNVTVRYANGDAVQNLSMYNFSASDIHGGAARDTFDYSDIVFNSSFDDSGNGSGIYLFNMSSWYGSDVPREGYHNISVTVSTNNSFSGTSLGNEQYYLLVPVFSTFTLYHSTSYEINEGNSRSGFHIYLYNNGTANATEVEVTDISSQEPDRLNTSSSCSGTKSIPNGTYADMCTVTFNAGSVGGDTSIYVTVSVSGNSTDNNTFTASSILSTNPIIVKNVADDDGDGTSPGGTTDGTTTCSTDSDCSATQWCDSGSCVEISCTDGEIVDHACVPYNYDVSLTVYPRSIVLLWGNASNDTKVTIENTGEKRATFELKVTSAVSSTVTPQGCTIDPGEECVFDVSFGLTESVKVGNHTSTFKAFRTSHEDVSDVKAFYFIVLPTEEQKAQIRADYQNVSALAQALVNRFLAVNASPVLNESDRAAIQPLMDEIIKLLSDGGEYSSSEDYANMNTVVDKINANLGRAETGVAELELKTGLAGGAIGTWMWIAVAVVIVLAVALLAYMMFPHKGGQYKRASFVPKRTSVSSVFSPDKLSFTSKSEQVRSFDLLDYGSGYKKHKAYYYEYGSRARRIRDLLSRLKPKGKSPQRSISDFVREDAGVAQ